jgi:hypothetical protein
MPLDRESMHTPGTHVVLASLLLALATLAPSSARANDRPFQEARTAVLEDEENTWSVDTWVQRYGKVRAFSFEPEYTFGGGNSMQVEFTRLWGRDGAESGQTGEIEFKHIFNNLERDGWGWAISGAVHRSRNSQDGSSTRGVGMKLPISLALGESSLLHINPGVEKESGERRAWTFAVGAEHEILRGVVLYGEVAREAEQRYGALGVRHWLKREKVALDVTLQQFRPREGARASGLLVALSLYDL